MGSWFSRPQRLARLEPSALRGPLALAVLYVVPLVLWARSAPLEQRVFLG